MKKSLVGFSILLTCVVLASCSNNKQSANLTYNTSVMNEYTPEVEVEEHVEEVVEESTSSDYSIAWIEKKSTVQDVDGYMYEVTVKVSPWIYSGNESILNDAWNEVGKGNAFPYLRNFYLTSRDNRYYSDWLYDFSEDPAWGRRGQFYTSSTDEAYYSVGQIEVKNITDGWDITENNPRNIKYSLGPQIYYSDDDEYGITYLVLGRIFYSTNFVDSVGGVFASPEIKKNTWGPVPFVLIAAEEFSPKYPNGGYYGYWKDSKLYGKASLLGNCQTIENEIGDNTYMGIINKDGEYFIPD